MQCAYPFPEPCAEHATHLSLKETLSTGLWHAHRYHHELPAFHHAEFCEAHARLVSDYRNQKLLPDATIPSVSSVPQKPKRSRKQMTETEPAPREPVSHE